MALCTAFTMISLLAISSAAFANEADHLCLLQQPDLDSTPVIKQHKKTKKEELEEVREQVKDDILKFSQLNQEKGQLAQSNAKLTTETDALSNTNRDMEKSLGNSTNVVEELKKLKSQDGSDNNEVENLLPNLHKLNGDVKEALGKKEQLQSALDKIANEKAEAQKLKDSVSPKHDALQKTLSELNQKYSDTMIEGHGRRLAPLQQFLKEAHEKNEGLRTDSSRAATIVHNQMAEMKELDQSVQASRRENQEIQSNIAKFTAENEKLRKENEKMKKGLVLLHSALNGDSSPPADVP